MPWFRSRLIRGSRYPLAIFAGALLALSFPNWSVAGLAWIAPGLFIALGIGKSGGEAFRLGYVAGLTHYLVSLNWLLNIPFRWHGIPVAPAVGWLSLSAFLSVFIGAWVFVLNRLASGGSNSTPESAWSGYNSLNFLPKPWVVKLFWCLTGAAAWVAIEMTLARIMGGFPWNILGASQYRLTPLLQIASLTGAYGVSFLIVWFSLSLTSAALQLLRQPMNRSALVLELAAPILTIAVLFNWGIREMRADPESGRSLKITLIQPSIPQTLIWDPGSDDERLRELIALSEEALTNDADLLVWPEAAVPKLLRYDQQVFDAVTGLARKHQVWMIIGADDAEPRADNPEELNYFNSSFLIDPAGELKSTYKKRALVIFGEYLPLARWLPFLKIFTPVQGGFTAGTQPVSFHLPELGLKTSVLICFEDIFPQVGRSAAEEGTSFLVNITNDGWFGEGSAQWQQAVTALFWAIENRVPLIRCTNNGLTCWIDGRGRFQQYFIDRNGSIYGRGFLRLELPLRLEHDRTFYNRHGDWFGWSCVIWSVVSAFALGFARVLRGRPDSGP